MARSPAALERHHVDVHVGKQLVNARIRKGINQSQVARMLGLTFQQVQKYEKGTNRMSASVLWTLSTNLGVPISYFFEGLSDEEITPEAKLSNIGKVGVQMADTYASLTPHQQRLLLELANTFVNKAA